MTFDRANTINFIMGRYEDIAEADLEEKRSGLNKLSDEELYYEAESLCYNMEKDAYIDWYEGTIGGRNRGTLLNTEDKRRGGTLACRLSCVKKAYPEKL